MSDYSASCDGVAVDSNGVLYSLAVFTDGEGFNSFVYRASDVASRTETNVRSKLLDIQIWLTSIWRSDTGSLYVTDDDGQVRRFDGAGWQVFQVSPQALTTAWGLSDQNVYAAGDEGIVYRWDGAAWSAISPPLGNTIFSIRGSSESDLYACGAGALFWHYDGRNWVRIELPTNQRLRGLLTLSAKDVLVCGGGGVLFRGSDDDWNDVSQGVRDFYSLALYNKTIHIAGGGEGIFTFDGAAVTNIKDTITSYRLAASDPYLASAGGNLAARFDGNAWFGSRYS